MTDPTPLEKLAEHRDALLLAEVGGWLHMLGKFSPAFLRQDSGYSDLTFYKDSSLKSVLEDKLFAKKLNTLNMGECSLALFCSQHRNRNNTPQLLKLLNDSHGRGSGTEKGVLKDASYAKQSPNNISNSNVYGYFQNIDQNLLSQRTKMLHQEINKSLLELKSIVGNTTAPRSNWPQWRTDFIALIKSHFLTSIADTRIPINDVSLWDQTMATVAFFKTELAEALDQYKEPDKSNKYHYRTLKISIDGLSFISQANKIPLILSRKALLNEIWDKVRNLLEMEYPIGLEIYRDMNGPVFLIPDVENYVQPITNKVDAILAQHLSGEAVCQVEIDRSGTRNVYQVGAVISKKPPMLSATSEFLKNHWKQSQPKCDGCQVRPISTNYNSTQPCDQCIKQVKTITRPTISTKWISEVAGKNGRVALVSAQFDLDDWISGAYLNSTTLLLQDPQKPILFQDLVSDFSCSQTELQKLNKYNSVAETHAQDKSALTQLLLDEDVLEKNSRLSDAEKLALAVWRKPPSFARINRIWTTCQQFWQSLIDSQFNSTLPKTSGRIVIEGESSEDLMLGAAYEIKIKNVDIEVVWDGQKLIVIAGYDYLMERFGIKSTDKEAKTELITRIKNSTDPLIVYNSDDGSEISTFTIKTITWDTTPYTPLIPILTDPGKFMVLVPADKVPEILKAIQTKYEVEFSKVKNRLPIHLNAIFFPRKHAIHAVMNTARRMARKSKAEPYTITAITNADPIEICTHSCGQLGGYVKKLTLKHTQLEQQFETMVSYSTADPNLKDVWYPYFFTEILADRNPQDIDDSLSLNFKAPLPGSGTTKILVHVSQLKQDDVVYYTPSTVDMIFLDTVSRRYGIDYDNDGNRTCVGNTQWPLILEDWPKVDRLWTILSRLTTSQIKLMAAEIEGKRSEWQTQFTKDQNTFSTFVEYVLKRSFGKKWASLQKTDQDFVHEWVKSGQWLIVLELYMTILKKRPNAEPKGDAQCQ